MCKMMTTGGGFFHPNMPKLENLKRTERELVTSRLGLCEYCGDDLNLNDPCAWALDHVIPISRGGSNHIDNKKVACRPCNASKAAKTIEEWRVKLGTPPGATFTPEQRAYWERRGVTLPPDDITRVTFFFEL